MNSFCFLPNLSKKRNLKSYRTDISVICQHETGYSVSGLNIWRLSGKSDLYTGRSPRNELCQFPLSYPLQRFVNLRWIDLALEKCHVPTFNNAGLECRKFWKPVSLQLNNAEARRHINDKRCRWIYYSHYTWSNTRLKNTISMRQNNNAQFFISSSKKNAAKQIRRELLSPTVR